MSKKFKVYTFLIVMVSFLTCGFGYGYLSKVSFGVTSYGGGSNSSGSVCPAGIASAKIVYETNGGNILDNDYISSHLERDTSFPVPKKDGYKFDGWYYDKNFTKKVVVDSYREVDYTPKKNDNGCTQTVTVNLYAKWLKETGSEGFSSSVCPAGIASAKIVYNSNGGNTLENDYISSKHEKDTTIPTPKKNGYKFVGWYYDSKFTKKVTVSSYTDLAFNSEENENGCTKTATVNLYAKWEKEGANCPVKTVPFKIIYNTNGGSKLSSYDFCSSCSLDDDEKIPVPARDGYVFNGWYYNSSLTKKVNANYPSEIDFTLKEDKNGCIQTTNVNLYAKWTKINSGNGGEPKNCPIPGNTFEVKYHTYTDVRYNSYTHCTSCVPEKVQIPIPEREGYKFAGWYYNEAFTDKVETDDVSKVEYIQEYDENACTKLTTVNLYARWLKVNSNGNSNKKYIVIYNTMGGKEIKSEEVYYNTEEKTEIKSPTKKRYKFAGWYYDKDYTNKVNVRYVENLDDKVDIFGNEDNITLYAKWEKDTLFKGKISTISVLLIICFVLFILIIIVNFVRKKINKRNNK